LTSNGKSSEGLAGKMRPTPKATYRKQGEIYVFKNKVTRMFEFKEEVTGG
jgi:hypothetical protein